MEKIGFDPFIAKKAAELLASMDDEMRKHFWATLLKELEKDIAKN